MLLVKRLRILREARESLEHGVAAGMSKDEAGEAMLEAMQAKYGADANWMQIIEVLLKILALFL